MECIFGFYIEQSTLVDVVWFADKCIEWKGDNKGIAQNVDKRLIIFEWTSSDEKGTI